MAVETASPYARFDLHVVPLITGVIDQDKHDGEG